MSKALFAYGSLIFPDVYEAVTTRARVGQPARLAGYARFRVLDASYPGIRPRAAASTDGVVYTDVTSPEIEALDVFEGDYYERVRVDVRLLAGEASVEAEAYVIRDVHAHVLSAEPWDPALFERDDKRAFLKRYAGFEGLEGEDDDPR